MLDVELADALLSACADGTHLVLVGDAAQLPSIGPGRVLGDVIDSGAVPVTELTTLYRQAEGGTIARLATAVRAGELPPVDDPTREVVIVPARGSAEAAHRVVQLVTDSIPRALGIAADQVQVVTPVHRGAAGHAGAERRAEGGAEPRPRHAAASTRATGSWRPPTTSRPSRSATPTARSASSRRCEPDGTVRRRVRLRAGGGQGQGAGRPAARLGDHRAPGAGLGVPGRRRRAAARGRRMLSRPLVYTALTRAQRHLSVVHAAGPARGARGPPDRRPAPAHPAGPRLLTRRDPGSPDRL